MPDAEFLPALRHVDIVPLQDAGDEPRFALVDRSGFSPHTLALSPAGYFILAHLDGRHSVERIQDVFLRELGVRIEAEPIRELVEALDANLMLETPRFEAAYAERLAAYRAAGVRDNRARYPDGGALRGQLRTLLESGSADGLTDVSGLVAPHLDYERGGPAYADAYATLARTPWADRFVILGTNHFGRGQGTVATTADFETPLGRVETDADFIAGLESDLGASLRAFELDHVGEHSIELQVHMLQVLAGGRPMRIVPLLCPYPCGPTGTVPPDGHGPDLRHVAEALARRIAADGSRRTVLIAGADLSHVGKHFGDAHPRTPESLRAIEHADRLLLELVARSELERFLDVIRGASNATRVCSAGCLFALRHALRGRPARLLRYHQATNHEADMHVTCAALAIL
ncbi:MAG: AmmeMemoRadiSam system protein B [Phycisphaerales bacterium]|nr:AmmeMemoRadiSam system protein B [Phycisphaerales bacterium]